MNAKTIRYQINNCRKEIKYLIENAQELKALLDYQSENMIAYNYTRAMADLHAIKDSITELEINLNYIDCT